jgi:formamidopyrimidine-DNA glycosylase
VPELPEVEVIRRDLEKAAVGATIRSARVAPTANALRVIRPHTTRAELEGLLGGRRILAAERWGKFLVLHLSGGLALVVHLGMSGQLLVATGGSEAPRHTHVVLDLAGGGGLRYVDPRTFGHLFVTEEDGEGDLPALAGLGPDALTGGLTAGRLAERLRHRTTRLKAALMDQHIVAGLGNIYSDEIAWAAAIHPFRPCDRLRGREVARLAGAMPEVLEEAIAHRGTSAEDEQYRDAHGDPGGHASYLQVYQRAGESCRRCGGTIAHARFTNRYAHFCPSCQH